MLVSLELDADFSRGCARPAMQPPIPTTHPNPQHKDRSPANGTPARRESLAALPWTALWLRVEVNHHPPSARAPLASHPPTTLNVVHAPLKASYAGALLVGTRSWSNHDLTPSTRRHRGRSGRLSCGCQQPYRSYAPTPCSRSDPQQSKSPCDHWHRRRS